MPGPWCQLLSKTVSYQWYPDWNICASFFYYYGGAGDGLNVDSRNANEMKECLFVATPYLKDLRV